MCELSVNDGEQQSEQNDGDRILCDDRNDKTESWVQNEMMNGQKIENCVQNELTGGHNIRSRNWQNHWVRNKLTSHSVGVTHHFLVRHWARGVG